MEIFESALLLAIKESLDIDLNRAQSPLLRAFSSKISLDSKIFIIVINKALINKFALDFLEIKNPDNDTIEDISKEVSNLIIGKAKVLYENRGINLKLGIPEFIGNKSIKRYNTALHFRHKNIRCSIYEV